MFRFARYAIALALASLASHANAAPPDTARSPVSTVFFRSLLIPGWGQWTQQRKTAATAFLAAEASLLLLAQGMQRYGEFLRDDYRSVAAVYAGLSDNRTRGHGFYVDIGNWNNTEEYNVVRCRERAFDEQYRNPSDQWRWQDDTQRRRFKDLRIRSDQMFDAVKFAFGAVVLNHFIAAIDASRTARKPSQQSLSFTPTMLSGVPSLALQVRW